MTETTPHIELAMLSALVEGELDAEPRVEVERHLAVCHGCAVRLDALRALVSEARSLPDAIEPPAELWDRVRANLTDPSPAFGRRAAMPVWRRAWFLAAAGLVLVVSSSWVTAVIVRRDADPLPATVGSSGAPAATLPASVARLEGDYLPTVRELEETLAARRTRLAPGTIATIEQSLRTIDAALAEARRALAEDPRNQGVLDLFTATYEHKLDLLRRAAELSAGA